jgi:hypothetical protein
VASVKIFDRAFRLLASWPSDLGNSRRHLDSEEPAPNFVIGAFPRAGVAKHVELVEYGFVLFAPLAIAMHHRLP